MAKNGHVHKGWKVGRSDATPTKVFRMIFMICSHSNLVMKLMIPSLLLKCQGHPSQCPVGKSKFRCYSVHLLQRSLPNRNFSILFVCRSLLLGIGQDFCSSWKMKSSFQRCWWVRSFIILVVIPGSKSLMSEATPLATQSHKRS